jgi:hypothetical protein
MFDGESLLRCRQQAVVAQATGKSGCVKPRVRKFASGFQQRDDISEKADSKSILTPQINKSNNLEFQPALHDLSTPQLSSTDQEILVHFHAHQIQRLIGPNAIFLELKRSASALSTAIMVFRRFYLSNSVIDFHPRNIAVASALLAVKVPGVDECRLEVRNIL